MAHLPDYLEISKDIGLSVSGLQKQFNGTSAWVILVDENTRKHCYPKISSFLPEHELIMIPSGENHKNLKTCESIWAEMTRMGLDRKALLLNLGGGVIGDMGGFAASAYKRGISFVNLPTTLLSQVDASIGGKLGVDFLGFKNHIGLFRDPQKVIVYQPFLESLPDRELRSGFAEVIKHNLIRDQAHWKKLKSGNWQSVITPELIEHSIRIKSEIVNEDPFENGPRKLLNYGHTVGHALETCYLESDTPLLHGEAIAAGMIIENFIAAMKNLIGETDLQEANEYILSVYGKITIQEEDIPEIVNLARQDKKNEKGEIRATLISGIGNAAWDIPVTRDELILSIHSYISI
ncbi:MAG: 3-dehydroquinate synthase [Cyclobacteriaceae bacterium]